MTSATIADSEIASVVDRLATHRTLGGVPRRELEWLAAHGELHRLEVGEFAQRKGDPVASMFIQLTGRSSLSVESSG